MTGTLVGVGIVLVEADVWCSVARATTNWLVALGFLSILMGLGLGFVAKARTAGRS